MRFLLLTAVLLWITGSPAAAQCTVRDVTFTGYGAGCTGGFLAQSPKLAGAWYKAPAGCGISLWITPAAACCNAHLGRQILLFGAAPTQVPLPSFGAGCALLTSPLVVFPYDMLARVFRAPLPAGIGRSSVFVQGVLEYYTVPSGVRRYAFSQGLRVDIR